jgi:DNA repair exonuclease SbcCD ATPase subunit
MLKELKVIAGFGHAGHTYFFEEGVTNITGPNGVGKSLLLDYLRYALFGVKALRGAAADYADLHVVLKFQVGNSTYTLERNNRKASLVDQAGNKTDGVKAVTVRVAELIGYGLEVFDIANCAMQGELEKFARMTGAERRKMIDNVMGLDILDDIVTLVQENARKEKNRLDVLTEKCVEQIGRAHV